MVGILSNLLMGFLHALTPINLIILIIGLIAGLIAGILPGLTLVMGVILLLPFTYPMETTQAIILLTAAYVAGTYGGAFTSILFHIPGEPIHVPLLWDGYAMTRRGEAAKALGWTLFAAGSGGLVASLIMTFVSEPFAKVALSFSTPEYFAIVLLGLTCVVTLGGGSVRRGVMSLLLGLLIATVGVDDIYGAERFTFGSALLRNGIDYVTVMVGAFAVGEILTRLEQGFSSQTVQRLDKIRTAFPTWTEIRKVLGSLFRSIGIGTLISAGPGAGATVASFVAYGVEKQYGRRKEEIGKGAPEGIIASQAAATASCGGALIHLLVLGIPGSAATAVILGAFMLHGVQPGPEIFRTSLQSVYTIFASVYLGVILMCVIGWLGVKPLVKTLDAPEAITSAIIMVLCFIGAFTIRNNITDVWMMVLFGIIGYLMERFGFPIAPLVLGSILGPLAERNFMTTMLSYHNDWTVFFKRPVSGVVMVLVIISALIPVLAPVWKKRKRANPE